MNNLKNNKIYNIARSSVLITAILSLIVSILRFLHPDIAKRLYFISSYIVWGFVNEGCEEYLLNERVLALINIIACCVLTVSIYLVLYFLSKKYLPCFIFAVSYYVFDSALFAYDNIILYEMNNLIAGSLIRAAFLAIMLVGLYYGFLGRSIEYTEEAAPDTKYTNKSYSQELAQVERKITIKREKSLVGFYVYTQCFLDYNSVCYLKNGDMYEITLDGNFHRITLVSHYEKIKTKKIDIPEGRENESYTISFKRKKLILKSLQIKKNDL